MLGHRSGILPRLVSASGSSVGLGATQGLPQGAIISGKKCHRESKGSGGIGRGAQGAEGNAAAPPHPGFSGHGNSALKDMLAERKKCSKEGPLYHRVQNFADRIVAAENNSPPCNHSVESIVECFLPGLKEQLERLEVARSHTLPRRDPQHPMPPPQLAGLVADMAGKGPRGISGAALAHSLRASWQEWIGTLNDLQRTRNQSMRFSAWLCFTALPRAILSISYSGAADEQTIRDRLVAAARDDDLIFPAGSPRAGAFRAMPKADEAEAILCRVSQAAEEQWHRLQQELRDVGSPEDQRTRMFNIFVDLVARSRLPRSQMDIVVTCRDPRLAKVRDNKESVPGTGGSSGQRSSSAKRAKRDRQAKTTRGATERSKQSSERSSGRPTDNNRKDRGPCTLCGSKDHQGGLRCPEWMTGACWYCNKTDHRKAQCPEYRNGCALCKVKGHVAAHCPSN